MDNNITPTITLAKLYESQNQLIDAIHIYTKLLELNPSDEIKTKVESLTNKIYTRVAKNYNRQINTIFSKFELKYFKILPNKEFLSSSESTKMEEEKEIPKETKKRKKTRKPDEDLKAKDTESETADTEKIKEEKQKVETLTQKEEVQKDVGEKQESAKKKPVSVEDIVEKSGKSEKQSEEIKEDQIQNDNQEPAVIEQVIEKDVVDEKTKNKDIKAILKEINEMKETISKDREVFFTKMYEIDKKLKEIDTDEIKEVTNLNKKQNEKEKDK